MGKHWSVSKLILLGVLSFLAYTESVEAASPSPGSLFTYDGVLTDSSGNPITTSQTLTFEIIYSPSCVTYAETQTLTPGSSGEFSVLIGSGTRTDSTGNTAARIFASSGNINCEGSSPVAVSGFTTRSLRIHVGATTLTPDVTIGNIPFAINAQNLGDIPASAVLRVEGASATPLTPANFTDLVDLINGSSNKYEKSGKLSGVSLPTMANGQVLGWNGSAWSAVTPMTSYTETDPLVKPFAKANLPVCSGSEFLKDDGAGNLICATPTSGGTGTVTSIAAGTGLITNKAANAPIADNGTLSVDVGVGANQIVQMGSDAKLPAIDGSKLTNVVATGLSSTASINTTGSITSPQINTRNLYIENTTPNRVTISAPSSFSDYSWTLPNTQGTNGQLLGMGSTAGQLEWKTLSASGVTSVAADTPLTVDSSTPSAPKVTLPKATGTVDGYLDKNDFATFNAKKTAGNYITTLQGDVASSNFTTGTVDVAVNKIKGVPVSAAPTLAGQVLRYEGGNFVPSFISMLDLRSKIDGSLALSSSCGTSKTLTFNSATDSLKCEDISITKSQISDLGLIGALAAKSSVNLSSDVTGVLPTANGGTGASSVAQGLFLAGPISAGSAAPTFRAITSTDLPPSASYWQSASGGIHYPGGKIGIGTNTPQAGLEIATTGTASAVIVPRDTTSARPPIPVNGMIRYNTDEKNVEVYQGTSPQWNTLQGTVARVDLTNQSTPIANTSIFTPTMTDFYNVCTYIQIYVAGSIGLLEPGISFNSGDSSSPTNGTLTGDMDISNSGWRASCTPIYAKAGYPISYFTNINGNPTILPGGLKYSLHIRITNMH